ncbi:prephenate dehydrogenase [Picrophilus oshimae]|uniref:Prephenate dehydrogenase n=1 Tax=Picrophilus torridus (strain ATCC 700027 / DSM 9790 / JCM 10055 / NBRC 100828 / KAW 2/3) TaxID=1122961 RepID=Q6L0T1_PICTO|nr:prephenate dehydrogenase [Picrophilus oshimae]AAT43421.1 prephenate dehydrogenase [Picrophilus oshimae DSM 9789]
MEIIIGANGRFGSLLCSLLDDRICIDIDNINELGVYIKKADHVFLSVPVDAALNIIDSYDYNNFVEISSVKWPFKKYSGKITSIHPLFGPMSYNRINDVIFINDISRDNSLNELNKIFKNWHFIEMTSDEHDLLMSEIMVKPYIISMMLDCKSDIKTGSYKKLLEVSEIKNKESWKVFNDTLIYNPYTMNVINDLIERLNKTRDLIEHNRL